MLQACHFSANTRIPLFKIQEFWTFFAKIQYFLLTNYRVLHQIILWVKFFLAKWNFPSGMPGINKSVEPRASFHRNRKEIGHGLTLVTKRILIL